MREVSAGLGVFGGGELVEDLGKRAGLGSAMVVV